MVIKATSLESIYKEMKNRLSKLIPEVELRYKAELVYEINKLKKERGAIILGGIRGRHETF